MLFSASGASGYKLSAGAGQGGGVGDHNLMSGGAPDLGFNELDGVANSSFNVGSLGQHGFAPDQLMHAGGSLSNATGQPGRRMDNIGGSLVNAGGRAGVPLQHPATAHSLNISEHFDSASAGGQMARGPHINVQDGGNRNGRGHSEHDSSSNAKNPKVPGY